MMCSCLRAHSVTQCRRREGLEIQRRGVVSEEGLEGIRGGRVTFHISEDGVGLKDVRSIRSEPAEGPGRRSSLLLIPTAPRYPAAARSSATPFGSDGRTGVTHQGMTPVRTTRTLASSAKQSSSSGPPRIGPYWACP